MPESIVNNNSNTSTITKQNYLPCGDPGTYFHIKQNKGIQ